MVTTNGGTPEKPVAQPRCITRISVAGYKSIGREQTIEVRPLTILAGANSSGKSSMMQPLLLLKQTLEATYDPGALLLNGPNVKFTSVEQMLFRSGRTTGAPQLEIGFGTNEDSRVRLRFHRDPGRKLDIQSQLTEWGEDRLQLSPNMSDNDLAQPALFKIHSYTIRNVVRLNVDVERTRCFLDAVVYETPEPDEQVPVSDLSITSQFAPLIEELIHLPGLRGNPERTYPVTAVGRSFPGTFENYVASIIASWSSERRNENLRQLAEDLKSLGLTWKVEAKAVDDTQAELKVGRLPQPTRGGAHDLVSIADVGFGMSQTLPVVVALLAARPGQLVYLEQPEIHLHPRAQVAMAGVLANAANRGVQVVAETHSSHLLLGVQTLVAEGKLSPDKVKLHWFQRPEGLTVINSADLDEAGAFGEWPEDFAQVELQTESRYIDAAHARLAGRRHG